MTDAQEQLEQEREANDRCQDALALNNIQLGKELARVKAERDALRERKCRWVNLKREYHCDYKTGCSHIAKCDQLTIEDNGWTHCPYCGGRIER